MVSLYFGLPRSGKTTILTQHAIKAIKSKKYEYVYSNIHLNIKSEKYRYIDNDKIGITDVSNSLLLIDEGTLFADNRDYKNFSKKLVQFFMLHGHYRCNIEIFTQQYDAIDKKIRMITERVYYIKKPLIGGTIISKYYRIPYSVLIPKKEEMMKTQGQIVMGYYDPPWYSKLLMERIVIRPLYYKYFDSWEAPPMEQYEEVETE